MSRPRLLWVDNTFGCASPVPRTAAEAHFEVLDSGGGHLDPIALTLPAGTPRTFLAAKYPNGKGSGFAPVLCERADEFVAPQANHQEQDAARVEIPVVIAGRLETSGARDFYRFHATKGQHLTLTAQSRSLGSPCDLFVTVLKPDGQKVAFNVIFDAYPAEVIVARWRADGPAVFRMPRPAGVSLRGYGSLSMTGESVC